MMKNADVPSQVIEVGEVEWQAARTDSLGPQTGARMKLLWSDPKTKRRAAMVRFEPGMQLETHRHLGDEIIFVIEGDVTDEWCSVTTGNVSHRPNGCIHTLRSKSGATLFAILTGDVEPARYDAEGPRARVFTLSDLAWTDVLPGLRRKPIWEDAETRRSMSLVRLEPGAKSPTHRHLGDELIYVIEGALSDEHGTVMAGNVGYRPDRCVHSITSRDGATLFALSTGSVEVVA